MSDEKKLWDDKPPYDSTTIHNKEMMTFIPPGNKYSSGLAAFNKLAMIPTNRPYLPDGREFGIRDWLPRANEATMVYGIVEIDVIALMKDKDGRSDGFGVKPTNELIAVPSEPIDFGDGRSLYIKRWSVRQCTEGKALLIDVSGFVKENKKESV